MSDEHEHKQAPQAIRVEALESILVEKGLMTPADVDDVIARYGERVGPLNGAKIVARAWKEADFKKKLLEDGTLAVADYEFEGGEIQKLVVVENTPTVHNAVVCTLCSCYPWAMLGLPPKWYKDPAYRARIVREPRMLLAEMGLTLKDDIEIKVWDSSAEVRYMVLPMQPAGTDHLDQAALSEIVTRDSMIGVEHLYARG
jgi:nitrile hydratase